MIVSSTFAKLFFDRITDLTKNSNFWSKRFSLSNDFNTGRILKPNKIISINSKIHYKLWTVMKNSHHMCLCVSSREFTIQLNLGRRLLRRLSHWARLYASLGAYWATTHICGWSILLKSIVTYLVEQFAYMITPRHLKAELSIV